jgi:hypothetical protein
VCKGIHISIKRIQFTGEDAERFSDTSFARFDATVDSPKRVQIDLQAAKVDATEVSLKDGELQSVW